MISRRHTAHATRLLLLVALLLAGLPAGTWVVSGLTLPGMAGDIDLLVVGALGASVIEVKYWAGRIVC